VKARRFSVLQRLSPGAIESKTLGVGNWKLGVVIVALSASCRQPPGTGSATPTFNKDVAPILFQHCAPCHRPGQHAVPFPLLAYGDASSRAEKIARATGTRRMPPWLPEAGGPAFHGERRLSAPEIETIARWAQAGAPEGVPADRRTPPSFPTDWELGTPDVVVTMPRPYTHRPGHHDVFRNIVLRPPTDGPRLVSAVEFRPGDAPIHHAIIRLDRSGESRRRDGEDGEPGFDGMAALNVQNPEGHFIGWAPGRGPIVAPEGMPWRLDAGSDLVVELHLLHGKESVAVQPTVGLYLTDRPPSASPLMVVMGTKAIDIPAGEQNYAIEDAIDLPADVTLLSVYPHAHYLGKTMRLEATLPDGSTKPLLHIRRWDFHWQQDYRYVAPVALPRGTRLTMRYTYDNSEANEANPTRPPRPVTWGPQSSDEMGNLGLQLLAAASDRALLVRVFAEREARDNVRGAEIRVRHAPGDPAERTWLGSSYLEAGRVADAIAQLEIVVRQRPDSVQARNFLGGALLAAGRKDDAITQLQAAVTLAPRDAHLQFNLGKALAAAGRPPEAADRFSRAIALDPRFAAPYQELGVLFFTHGRLREALPHLQRAVELAPDSAPAHSDLGGALAEAGRFDDAAAHLRRALELDPSYGPARENLARLSRR
jgi:tetratricopeptide (TPR) repeat protein